MDKEKVIKAVDICLGNGHCADCHYCLGRAGITTMDCRKHLLTDVLAMLKEQKHGETFTVIDTKTGKEADEYEIALHEDWAKQLCYCDMDGWAIMDDGTLLLVDECGRFEYADRERFKVVWDD